MLRKICKNHYIHLDVVFRNLREQLGRVGQSQRGRPGQQVSATWFRRSQPIQCLKVEICPLSRLWYYFCYYYFWFFNNASQGSSWVDILLYCFFVFLFFCFALNLNSVYTRYLFQCSSSICFVFFDLYLLLTKAPFLASYWIQVFFMCLKYQSRATGYN